MYNTGKHSERTLAKVEEEIGYFTLQYHIPFLSRTSRLC